MVVAAFLELGHPPFCRAVRLRLEPALRVLRGEVAAPQPVQEPFLEAENGRRGRVRFPSEAAAIPAAYAKRDRWALLPLGDQVNYLRKLRRELALMSGRGEYAVTREELAKAAGVPVGRLRGMMFVLAGDFVQTQNK